MGDISYLRAGFFIRRRVLVGDDTRRDKTKLGEMESVQTQENSLPDMLKNI